MKKLIYIFLASAVVLAVSCKKDEFNYGDEKDGVLSFAGLSLDVSEDVNQVATKASVADDNYSVTLYDSSDKELWTKTYGEVRKEGEITLKAGTYRIVARSTKAAVPEAKFNSPVYGASKEVVIKAGEKTTLGAVTCTLLQTVVTVNYNEAFLKSVTGDGTATVELMSGYPLEYKLTYSDKTANYDRRSGYFAVDDKNTTLTITFKGSIEGKTQKMKTTITGVKARDWHIITIMKKVDESGNASFAINIDGLVQDAELTNDVAAEEKGDGNDPNAPTGDGGIELVSTCSYDITKTVTVPATGSFPLTMQAKVPNGVRKFTVEIASDNEIFMEAVGSVGGSTLDLINPSEEAMGIFEIVPFPHGSELSGKTEIDFDLSGAQTPLLGFSGTHTFTMTVVDSKGCRKSVPISLKVL